MVTLLYPQASGIGMARDGGGERMAEIDFLISQPWVLWSYMNNTPIPDPLHTPLGLLWKGLGSKDNFPAVGDSS